MRRAHWLWVSSHRHPAVITLPGTCDPMIVVNKRRYLAQIDHDHGAGAAGRRRRANSAAAAAGSGASVMARTTTTRRAPAASTSSSRPRSMPPIANQGRAGWPPATWLSRPRPVAGRPGLVGVTHERAGAEVVHAGLGRRRGGLFRAVAAPPDQRVRAEDAPGHRHRQVVLAEVQHIRAGRQGDVGPVVHGQQPAVPPAGRREHLQQPQFLPRLQPLLAQLHDVHPGREHPIQELGQIPPVPPPVGAQVQPRIRQPLPQPLRVSRHRAIQSLALKAGGRAQGVPTGPTSEERVRRGGSRAKGGAPPTWTEEGGSEARATDRRGKLGGSGEGSRRGRRRRKEAERV